MSKEITLEELLAAWMESGISREAGPTRYDEGWTTREMCEASGKSRFWVAEQVRAALKAGTCQRGWKHVERIDGYRSKCAVYKFTGGLICS